MSGRQARRIVLGAAVLCLGVGVAGPAEAAAPPLATGLVGPLGLAVTPNGTVYVAQSFANTLTRISPGGAREDLATDAQGISGISVEPDGGIVYTYSIQPDRGPQIGQLRRLGPDGKTTVLGKIARYEFGQNPDRINSYGFQGLTRACADSVPPQIGGHPYKGMKDSHPYAVARLADGSHAVADAGVNAILRVGLTGQVTTMAVLPPVPVVVTAAAAQGLGLPACVVGKTYNFEPVPTDVDVAPNGKLYVSSLPGGPEDGSLGPLGGVFTVDPANGSVERVGSGFGGATGLAVGPQGRVYVAELYSGQISYLNANGRPTRLVSVPGPAAVEFARGRLYATTNAVPTGSGPPDGKVQKFKVS